MNAKANKEDVFVEPADAAPEGGAPEGAEAPENPGSAEDTVEALKAKVDALEDKMLRTAAEFENRRKRIEQQRDDAIRFGNVDLLRALLVVVDDFERSLAAARQAESIESVIEGEAMIHANLVKVLRDYGLQEIDALHKPFDPACHEALMQQPSSEHPPGTVIEEIARGYRFRDRVVRPSKVIVSKAVDSPGDDSGDAPDVPAGGGE